MSDLNKNLNIKIPQYRPILLREKRYIIWSDSDSDSDLDKDKKNVTKRKT